ncbi:MAG: murein biosynthesis integral membrane protein MurJ [Planctomycetes bacterium]|nr:murein biosynthesis integral membrane protein MurJ [Planctomycetota bacterium]
MSGPARAQAPGVSSPPSQGGILRAASTVGSWTLASRVLGLVRDMLNARVLGDSPAMDAFALAFRIPNLFRRMFGEGAFASALVPVWGDVRRTRSREDASRWLGSVLTLLGGALVAVVLLQWGAAGVLRAAGRDLFGVLLFLMAPYALLICQTAAWGAVLQVEGRFASTAFSPVVLNLFWIGALAWALAAGCTSLQDGPRTAAIVAGSILAAGAVQWTLQVVQARRIGLRPRPGRITIDADTRRLGTLMLPMAFGAAVFQVNLLVDSFLADSLGPGAVSHIHYADRLMELPLGLLGLSLATAAFPRLGELLRTGDRAGAANAVRMALRVSVLMLLPATAGLAILARPILSLLFEARNFNAEAVGRTAEVLVAYAAGLSAFGVGHLLVRLLQASKRPAVAVRIGVLTVMLKIVLSLWWMVPLREAGLAWATSAGALFQTALLWWAARFYGLLGEGSGWLRGSLLRALCATAAMSLAVGACSSAAAPLGAAAQVLAGVPLGICIYLLLAGGELRRARG